MIQYSFFIGLWLVGSWPKPGSPEALLYLPFPHQVIPHSAGRSHTWKQCVDKLATGPGGSTRRITSSANTGIRVDCVRTDGEEMNLVPTT